MAHQLPCHEVDEILKGLAASDHVELHVSRTGGIGNVIPNGSNDRMRSFIPSQLNNLFKLPWSRQKPAGRKDKLTIDATRSGPSSKVSPSAIGPDPQASPESSPAAMTSNSDYAGSLRSFSISTDSSFPTPRLRSHKSLSTMSDRPKTIYNSQFNSSTKCLRSNQPIVPLSSHPFRLSKEKADSVDFHRRKSSEKSINRKTRDGPKSRRGSTSQPSASKIPMQTLPQDIFKEKNPNSTSICEGIIAHRSRANSMKLEPSRSSASPHTSCYQLIPVKQVHCQRGKSFDSSERKLAELSTLKNSPTRPHKASARHDSKKMHPAPAGDAVPLVPLIPPAHSPIFSKFGKKIQSNQEEFAPRLLAPMGPRDEDNVPPQRPKLSLDVTVTEPRMQLSSRGAVSCASTFLGSDPNSITTPHREIRQRRSLGTPGDGSGAQVGGTSEDVSPQIPQVLVEGKKPYEGGQTSDENAAMSRIISHVYSSNLQPASPRTCAPDTSVLSVNDPANFSDFSPILPSASDGDNTTSSFETEVYDELENVQFMVGSRIYCADPPLKGVYHEMQSLAPENRSPPQNSQNRQKESHRKASYRLGKIYDSCHPYFAENDEKTEVLASAAMCG